MARTIETFPAAYTRRSPYPNEWLDGRVWELQQGEDFDVPTSTLVATLRSRAKEHGKRLRTRTVRLEEPSVVVIQAYEPER